MRNKIRKAKTSHLLLDYVVTSTKGKIYLLWQFADESKDFADARGKFNFTKRRALLDLNLLN